MELKAVDQVVASISLAPLSPSHRAGLSEAAREGDLWRWWPRGDMSADFDTHFDWQQGEVDAGRWIIHTVFDNDRIVGQTCYLAIRPEHRGVEIGGTWYRQSAQGSRVNPACKYMLLDNAFACEAERVELKTDANNARSRAAIEKMGATFEGVFRRHMLYPDGRWRDTAWYSVIREDWPRVAGELQRRL